MKPLNLTQTANENSTRFDQMKFMGFIYIYWFYSLFVLYVYLSACLLQKQSVDYAHVREYSLRVLQWRPDDVKALYRAGVAILEMGDAQTAKHYLTKACNGQPNGKT